GRVGNLLAALDDRPPLIHGRRIINLDRDAHALSPNHLGGEGFSEISLAFEFGGHRESGKARILIADTFPREEEKCLLFPLVKFGQPNRAAESSAVEVVMRQRFVTTCSIGLEQVGVESRILMKLVQVPMIFTGPALERNIDRASGLSAVLGIVGVCHNT